jgi:fatty acid-binding protein DegV
MGEVTMLERVRTSNRAFLRFLEVASDLAPFDKMALLHTHASENQLADLREKTRYLYPTDQQPLMVEMTPTLGTHLGPNGLGIAGITRN